MADAHMLDNMFYMRLNILRKINDKLMKKFTTTNCYLNHHLSSNKLICLENYTDCK